MDTPVIPKNFVQWKHCIVHECGIPLERTFLETRIKALSNASDQHTKQFVRLYGAQHHKQVLQWFNEALLEVA